MVPKEGCVCVCMCLGCSLKGLLKDLDDGEGEVAGRNGKATNFCQLRAHRTRILSVVDKLTILYKQEG